MEIKLIILCLLSLYCVQINCIKPISQAMASEKQYEYFQSDDPNAATDATVEVLDKGSTNNNFVIDGNPNFDQKLHENFLPHDPIQQYVNAYGGPYLPPSSAFGYPNMQWGPYGPQSHIPIAYAPVQTEYEGILLPVPGPPPPPPSPHSLSIHETGPLTPPFFSEMIYFVKDLMPRSLIYMIARWSAFLISLFGLVAFGGVITTAICTFTPLCTISFAALPFAAALRTTIASKVDDNASTIERVRRATEFFNSAIQKYEHLQRTVDMRTKSP